MHTKLSKEACENRDCPGVRAGRLPNPFHPAAHSWWVGLAQVEVWKHRLALRHEATPRARMALCINKGKALEYSRQATLFGGFHGTMLRNDMRKHTRHLHLRSARRACARRQRSAVSSDSCADFARCLLPAARQQT